ncbi:E2/UBC family protein, partial [Ammoniphilus oxalaticus]|uniref:E2/UBC family protein n=1 Tax=Ammoniphilus oxalaticus TaxID=66863 RepID=UPI0011C34715
MDIIKQAFKELQEYDENMISNIIPISLDERMQYRNSTCVYELELSILGKLSVLTIGFPFSFPRKLPLIFDKSRRFPNIPHIETDRLICYTLTDSIIIDERFPGAVLLQSLQKA